MANIIALLSGYHIVQAVLLGGALAFLTATVIMKAALRAATTTVNGWRITLKCGRPGNGILLRAACARYLPAVNAAQEAAYWTTTVDAAGRPLNGRYDYVLRFPAGRLPPNGAFWSLTVTDVAGFMTDNPIGRYGVGSLTGLAPNAAGSVEIHIRNKAPSGPAVNWLPAPAGKFKLTLRAYLPGAAVLDGGYRVPPVVKAE
jgi:hypothetical protein